MNKFYIQADNQLILSKRSIIEHKQNKKQKKINKEEVQAITITIDIIDYDDSNVIKTFEKTW